MVILFTFTKKENINPAALLFCIFLDGKNKKENDENTTN